VCHPLTNLPLPPRVSVHHLINPRALWPTSQFSNRLMGLGNILRALMRVPVAYWRLLRCRKMRSEWAPCIEQGSPHMAPNMTGHCSRSIQIGHLTATKRLCHGQPKRKSTLGRSPQSKPAGQSLSLLDGGPPPEVLSPPHPPSFALKARTVFINCGLSLSTNRWVSFPAL
jgi:hypothetical protein